MESLFDTREYRRSRKAYVAQSAFDYFVTILVADAFLARLLKQIGLTDAECGVISSLVSFSFLFQLFAILLMQRMKNVKRTVIAGTLGSQLLFLGVYFVPFLPISGAARRILAAVGILGGYALRELVISLLYRWCNSYVDPYKRGEFSAVREMISLLSGIAVTLSAGFLFDRFEKGGAVREGFMILAAFLFLSGLLNFICLCMIDRGKTDEEEHRPLGEVVRAIFKNRAFLRLTVLTCLWSRFPSGPCRSSTWRRVSAGLPFPGRSGAIRTAPPSPADTGWRCFSPPPPSPSASS